VRSRLEQPTSVRQYLAENPFLVDLLDEVYPQITKYFGDAVEVALRVITYPESKESTDLFVLVNSGLAPDSAASILGRFDGEWWGEQLQRARGKLVVDLKFD
jgi:hypothetical protein